MRSGLGIVSTTGRLRRVLVRRPDETFEVHDPAKWNYSSTPDLAIAQAEHDALVAVLEKAGATVEYHAAPQAERADAVFVFDPVLMTESGAVLLRMGKTLRSGEEEALGARLEELGVPILGRLAGEALAEGGDILRLDDRTLAIGIGFRTNLLGIEQLTSILAGHGERLLPFELPYFQGPRACLHLLSLVSLLDTDLAVVYPRLMPVPFWRLLAERFELVEVPDEEFLTMAPNVLSLGPRSCLMLEGNPITRERLERAGCEVHTYRGRELSLKAEGGSDLPDAATLAGPRLTPARDDQTTGDSTPDVARIDCRGLLCPLPVRLTEKAIAELPVGAQIEVVCTDPAAEVDLAAFCARTGHRFSRSASSADEFHFRIEKA